MMSIRLKVIKELWFKNPEAAEMLMTQMGDEEKNIAKRIISSIEYEVIPYTLNDCRIVGEGLIHQNKEEIQEIKTIFGSFSGNGAELLNTIAELKQKDAYVWLKNIGAPDSCLFWDEFYIQNQVPKLLDKVKGVNIRLLKNAPIEVMPSVLVWLWGLFNEISYLTPFIKSATINDKGHVVVNTENASKFIGAKGCIINKIQQVLDRSIVVL